MVKCSLTGEMLKTTQTAALTPEGLLLPRVGWYWEGSVGGELVWVVREQQLLAAAEEPAALSLPLSLMHRRGIRPPLLRLSDRLLARVASLPASTPSSADSWCCAASPGATSGLTSSTDAVTAVVRNDCRRHTTC
jgi:hypothetical protein